MIDLALSFASAVTPVGDDLESTMSSIRAGVSGLTSHPTYRPAVEDPEWDPRPKLTAAMVHGVDPDADHTERFVALGLIALRGLIERAALRRADLADTHLVVATAGAGDPSRPPGLAKDLVPEILRRAGIASFAGTSVAEAGHSGFLSALTTARARIDDGARRVAILAVDSFLTRARLRALDEQGRIRSARNKDAFFPGEAAAAILAMDAATHRREGGKPLAIVRDVGLGVEPQPSTGERFSTGTGLSTAIRALPGDTPFQWAIGDLDGESYRSLEWAIASARVERARPITCLDHPASSTGNAGAAAGAIQTLYAAWAFARGFAPAETALVFTGSDDGRRAVAAVTH